MVRDAIDFIRDKGGPAAIARATGHSPGAVSVWKNRNRLPRAVWPEIMAAFPEVTLDTLLIIEEAAPARPSKVQKPHPEASA